MGASVFCRCRSSQVSTPVRSCGAKWYSVCLLCCRRGIDTKNNTHTHKKHMRTEQRLCVAAASHSDHWHTAFPLLRAGTYQSLGLFTPCLLMLTLGFFAACAHTHSLTATHQYLWGSFLAVVPVRAWLLGSVCLVLIWLHKLHHRRGFTLNRIFELFIGRTLKAESYLMSRVLEDRKG